MPTTAPPSDSSNHEPAADTEEVFLAPETVSVDLPALPTSDFSDDHPFRVSETVPLAPPQNDVGSLAARHQELAETVPLPPVAPHQPAARSLEESARPRAAREIGGEVKKGFGKVREISTVMLDEASYDPSARFVLVAAVLFVLFLVILILSEMMR